ncbi:Coenzyme F420 hydrogenase/dehydrogenase, beta subunit C-terminal domain [Sphaerochaeta globosa]|uniref:Coenzyme F420 hydrogenase/dehydrogenase beta subunit domain protein n=1 Tax=Sphaerochaeta globosa (strain ATCC BAA-1886 / DSM 22777 / Buddy) TaxID=158189 RepID=F0RXV4_SPHGB|nr:Coenzyme F420 hydrogenase/dehydrogenase, beta subunit C-terminal domain [Sphaerochaeta globosa]ADY12231.1 coenzyme F420 hydrogenase/dehydrogenase beta subunit domain protein [Sphaerochaeta globosa str. Buddy]
MDKSSIEKVIAGGYCIGCGVCTAIKDSPFLVQYDEEEKYQARIVDRKEISSAVLQKAEKVCPFAYGIPNEDELGATLYSNEARMQHNEYLGYFFSTYAGYVEKPFYRSKGSSGGMGSWLACTMLEAKLIDYVIHVRHMEGSDKLFSYTISSRKEEIEQGAKSKYYPVELSSVLEYVRDNPGKYLLIGVPCFIKAVRLLSEQEKIFKERIVFTMGLVCGHLKTGRFAKAIGWQMGIHPDNLESIDFRVKLDGSTANAYGVSAKGKADDGLKSSSMKNILINNWGYGIFRYNACDYCDDVLSETADVTIGDAWLPEFVNDNLGTNVIIIRNPHIDALINEHIQELHIQPLSADKVFQSQEGGFRHRREGLAYRLFLKDKEQEWRPKKRVVASNAISSKRKKIYEMRIPLLGKVNEAYELALTNNDFKKFEQTIKPYLSEYNTVYRKSFLERLLRKLKKVFN